MDLGQYTEKLRSVYDDLTGADDRETETVVGVGPVYIEAESQARKKLPDDVVDDSIEAYELGTLDMTDADDELEAAALDELRGDELTVAVLEYEVADESESASRRGQGTVSLRKDDESSKDTGRSRGAGAPGDLDDTGSNSLAYEDRL